MNSVQEGVERFTFSYKAYPHQQAFHESSAPRRLLGGAAGPGKTLALIMDHMMHCNRFPAMDAPQVHTLILRRTHPKLESTVITRFREKIPKELYQDYNEQKHIVTWRNGSTTQFGSMQHEHDVWGWQGQWYKIGFDELTEFTFGQWQNISAWNRCPVAQHSTKDGATNPIGIGAGWVESLFVRNIPCTEMEKNQRDLYRKEDYAYFPATYLDNPVYANDPTYIANLDSYQSGVSKALKYAIWGVAGGYYDGAWDEAENTYPADAVEILPHWHKWMGGDWGFEHNSAIYWLCLDDLGIVRVYRELVVNKHTPEELGEAIAKNCIGADGKLESYKFFSFSHDAFAQKQDFNPNAFRVGNVLRRHGIVEPSISTRDADGRDRVLYSKLKERIRIGAIYDDATKKEIPVEVAGMQIADTCTHLIRAIPKAPRDEKKAERMAEFLGDDPIQGVGYALYGWFGKPAAQPFEVTLAEELSHITDPTSKMVHRARLVAAHEQQQQPTGRLRWMRQR